MVGRISQMWGLRVVYLSAFCLQKPFFFSVAQLAFYFIFWRRKIGNLPKTGLLSSHKNGWMNVRWFVFYPPLPKDHWVPRALMPERWTLTRMSLPDLVHPVLVALHWHAVCDQINPKDRPRWEWRGNRAIWGLRRHERCAFCSSYIGRIKSAPWNSGFSNRGHLAISGDIFGCPIRGLRMASDG